jgi:hypothetical protein
MESFCANEEWESVPGEDEAVVVGCQGAAGIAGKPTRTMTKSER